MERDAWYCSLANNMRNNDGSILGTILPDMNKLSEVDDYHTIV